MAVSALRDVLAVRSAEATPVDWAAAQHDLGRAFAILADHEQSTANLRLAIESYEQALTVRTRQMPIAWLATQNGLGAALTTLGQRTESISALQRATDVLYDALEVHIHVGTPDEIATTRRNYA
jgi:tetratricopeptide (TPR) repeat protein